MRSQNVSANQRSLFKALQIAFFLQPDALLKANQCFVNHSYCHMPSNETIECKYHLLRCTTSVIIHTGITGLQNSALT